MTAQASATDFSAHIQLLKEAVAGHLDGLKCPTCAESSVSAWFTNPAKDIYRTWFLCASCGFHSRVRDSEKPPFYSEDRVRNYLDGLDGEIVERKKVQFKRPPQDT
jgi:Zn ribbon nucleic-acid-binding protein